MSKKKKSRLPTVDTRSRPSSPSPPTDQSPTLVTSPLTALVTPAAATAPPIATPRIQDNPFFSLSDTSMGPKDKEDPTAKEGVDDDDPGEDSLLDQEFKRIIQIFFRIKPNKHHEVYRALQASGIVSLRLLLEDGANVINTLQKQGKRGDLGSVMVLTKIKLKKIRALGKSLDRSGLDPMDTSLYTEEVINNFIAKAMRLEWDKEDPEPSTNDNDNHDKRGSDKKEKHLIYWKKQKYDPTRFKQLHSQGSYLVWKTNFLIQVDQVECRSMIDPDPKYNKENLTDPYDIELYEAKNLFLWSVLEHVMVDTAPRNTLYSFMGRPPDARAAYLAIDEELSRSIIQDDHITESLTELFLTKYDGFKGTRCDFLFKWHTLLRKHNTIAGKHSALRYPTIRSNLVQK